MINQLVANIKKTGAPIVVGLDPMLNYIPEQVQKKAFAEYGETLEGAAEAIWQFNKEIVDKTYDLIPAVKPQIAMYEQFGLPGLAAFKKTVDYCKEKGLVVIGDIKRGDIGSTSAAYAVGHIGKVKVGSKTYAPFDEDFVTVNPYLGSDGVNPFLDVCKEEKKGIFVLVKTSNPSSGEFQDRLIDGRPLYEHVGEKVNEWAMQCMGDDYSYVGAVVGAVVSGFSYVLSSGGEIDGVELAKSCLVGAVSGALAPLDPLKGKVQRVVAGAALINGINTAINTEGGFLTRCVCGGLEAVGTYVAGATANSWTSPENVILATKAAQIIGNAAVGYTLGQTAELAVVGVSAAITSKPSAAKAKTTSVTKPKIKLNSTPYVKSITSA